MSESIVDALAEHDVKSIREQKKHWRKPNLSHIPKRKGVPIAGNFPAFIVNAHKVLNKLASEQGNVALAPIFHKEVVFMFGPEANELILKNQQKIVSNHLAWNEIFRGVFDNVLLERDFNSHKYHRKLLQLAFKRDAIEGYAQALNEKISTGLNSWQTDKTISTMPMLKSLLLNVGAEIFLGLQTGKEADKLNKAFVDMVASTIDLFRINMPFTPYAKGVKGRAILSGYIFKNIAEKRRNEGADIFSRICRLKDEAGVLLSDEDIRDHMIFLLFAAHDTTTSTLSSILYCLATHQDWQEKLRAEILSFNKESLSIEDTEAMTQASLVFHEALRMYPPLPMMFRYTLKPFEYDGVKIPANTLVCVSPLHSHYLEEYWTNPHQFDPERFSADRAEHKKNFYQFIPFGGGAHKPENSS